MLLKSFVRIRTFFVFVLLFVISEAKSQQYFHWFFGNYASLNFNADSFPIPYSLPPSAMLTPEACSAIDDESRHLLFYTNGRTIFNRFNETMFNGDSLSGHESAAQGALIIPMPGNDSLFYVFTTDAIENDFKNGYRYSVVNMHKDGGKGAVVIKNAVLQSSCSERLTAVRHADGVNVWIITNDKSSNIFRAWLLTCNGLASVPVVSAVGDVLNKSDRSNIGVLKVSPNGKKICQTSFADDVIASQHNFFQLFDFNNTTGQLTNPLHISLPNADAYACEFSPDSKLLYLTDPFLNQVSQVECTLPTSSAIAASTVSVRSSFGYYAMQLGPDNKIYLDRDKTSLSVIQHPNIKGVGCLLQENKIGLNGSGKIGLPSTLKDLTETGNDFDFSHIDSCAGSVQFRGHTILQNSEWKWDFGDGVTSNLQNPIHNFSPANKIYVVIAKIKSPEICGSILKFKYVVPRGILAKADFSFDGKCDSGYVKFINTSHYLDSLQFLWSFGDGTYSNETNPVHAFPNSGTYRVKLLIKTPKQCIDDSVTKILDLNQLDIHASVDQTILEGNSVQLNAYGNATRFEWTPVTWLNNPLLPNPIARPEQTTTYYVTGTDNLGCIDIDSVHITVKTFDDIYIPSAFTPNNDHLNDDFKPLLGLKFSLINFSVYNRWGQLVFGTHEKGEGWDGKYKGQQQNTGIYTWLLKAVDKQGKLINKTGTVLLIR
jgi:gliding motility-associated-like protein